MSNEMNLKERSLDDWRLLIKQKNDEIRKLNDSVYDLKNSLRIQNANDKELIELRRLVLELRSLIVDIKRGN